MKTRYIARSAAILTFFEVVRKLDNLKFCKFLGRHFGCRPLDPTLDIWSNFVKRKKKKKHFTSLQCRKGSQGFPKVT